MTDWWQQLLQDLANTQPLEIVAVIFAVAYVVLAARQSIWCWLCAIVSTALYTVLYFKVALLSNSLLNIYYLVIAVYGWYVWRGGADRSGSIPVRRWSWRQHVVAIVITSASVPILAWWTIKLGAKSPYIDAATTCFAVLATYMVARKILENWLYWVVIDLVEIYVSGLRGLALTSLLFMIYVVMAVYGYQQWLSSYRRTFQFNN